MTVLRLATVVGARPQFVKAAAVSRAIARHDAIEEIIVHTGQHYDDEMSDAFFRELGLLQPAHHLGVGSGPHGAQTGEMLARVEEVLIAERPDAVVVYGDTNSTLAGALAAAKLAIPVAHVEAGLRSYNRSMPEELNRVLTDHVSTWLFCPSRRAVENLAREGIEQGVELVGDVMRDMVLAHAPAAAALFPALAARWGLRDGYALATIHRAENTDDPARLSLLLSGLERVASDGLPVVVPLHPRTQAAVRSWGISTAAVQVLPPVSYEEVLCLQSRARVVVTDSGGVQKEAYWLGVPCVTLREETEWPETVELGWNTLAGCDPDRIVGAVAAARAGQTADDPYGDGRSADRILQHFVGARVR